MSQFREFPALLLRTTVEPYALACRRCLQRRLRGMQLCQVRTLGRCVSLLASEPAELQSKQATQGLARARLAQHTCTSEKEMRLFASQFSLQRCEIKRGVLIVRR